MLEQVLAEVFDPAQCTNLVSARRALREKLDRAGLGDWVIEAEAVGVGDCVTWALSQSDPQSAHTVKLIVALSPVVRTALADARERTYASCLTKDEAIDLIRSTLIESGVADFQIRTDGPFQVPLDRQVSVVAHYDAGCWMYSTVGWFDGRPVFFISGKDDAPGPMPAGSAVPSG